MPELKSGGIVLGAVTFLFGVAIAGTLLRARNGERAAWLHVGTALFTMVMAFAVLMPLAQDRFSVKTMALQYDSLAKDPSRVLYVDKQLRPGLMLYTDIPGIEADTNDQATLERLREDSRPKYILIRDYMYRKKKEEMGAKTGSLYGSIKGSACTKAINEG